MLDLNKRSTKNRTQLIEDAKNDIRRWYHKQSTKDPKAEVNCEEVWHDDAFGVHRWWIEPFIKGVKNPVLESRPVGNGDWQLDIVPVDAPIKSFGGI